ncbi:hypothetical protein B0H13DRAFT_1861031 [Mycena leptocephala]|nr:hypothetical protein B0H13DRAFT_1861031 [Mycena leptocephala]
MDLALTPLGVLLSISRQSPKRMYTFFFFLFFFRFWRQYSSKPFQRDQEFSREFTGKVTTYTQYFILRVVSPLPPTWALGPLHAFQLVSESGTGKKDGILLFHCHSKRSFLLIDVFILPNWPVNTKWLSQKEKALAAEDQGRPYWNSAAENEFLEGYSVSVGGLELFTFMYMMVVGAVQIFKAAVKAYRRMSAGGPA